MTDGTALKKIAGTPLFTLQVRNVNKGAWRQKVGNETQAESQLVSLIC